MPEETDTYVRCLRDQFLLAFVFLYMVSQYQQCAGTALDTLRNRRHPGILKPDYAENSSKAYYIAREIYGFVTSADGLKVR